jgi:hypothetical protein
MEPADRHAAAPPPHPSIARTKHCRHCGRALGLLEQFVAIRRRARRAAGRRRETGADANACPHKRGTHGEEGNS